MQGKVSSSESNSVSNSYSFTSSIIGRSAKMQKIFHLISKVAPTHVTVLLLGETGTGKEVIAKTIHKESKRKGPLVTVNCGAIPENLLESELFGYEKGAFTGAVESHQGKFQQADGGTIFLDEIGELSPKLQVKLLRVLQESEINPLGSSKQIPINVRVVAATNKDLKEEVKKGEFRSDLFYRLQVVPIKIPALRERASDVKLLTEYFIKKVCLKNDLKEVGVSPEVEEVLSKYEWPGNVRELENLVERLMVFSEGETIQLEDLPPHIFNSLNSTTIFTVANELPVEGVNFKELVTEFENRLITMAISKTQGNKNRAAKLLNLNRTTLIEKIKKKGLKTKTDVFTEDDSDSLLP